MESTDAKATGADLQGAGSTTGNASGRDLQGSNPQTNENGTAVGINNLQPQGQITVQDIATQIAPKTESGGGVIAPLVIAFLLAALVVVLVALYRKYLDSKITALPEVAPIDVALPATTTKKANTVKSTANNTPKQKAVAAKKKKPTPKKRASTGRKKR